MCLLLAGLGESIRAIRTEARERRLRQQEAVRSLQATRIRAMRLELELLKANIQPHFMLNSINSAIMWIGENPPAAVKLLHSLSLELKQLLKIVAAKVIPIGEEIRICRLHLEVMSLRHDKRFALRVEGVEAGDRIPPLVVHTLIENGLTHGFAGKDEGSFVLSRSQAADGIRFTLFNDGAAGNDGADSGGLGLRYVRARLEEAYGRNWRLDSRPVDGGWLVTIFIGSNAFGKPADAHGSFPEGVPGLPSAGGPGPEAYRGKGATAFPPRPAPEPVR
jgi:LytS/YehU family sensor histidine kinase